MSPRSFLLLALLSSAVTASCVFDGTQESGSSEVPSTDAALPTPLDDARAPASADGATTDEVPRRLVPDGSAIDTRSIGGRGGRAFATSCPEGRVIVGFDAGDNIFGLTQLRAICVGLIEIHGEVTPVGETLTEAYGTETSVFDLDPVRCPTGHVVVGYDGSRGGRPFERVHSLRLRCAPLSWDGNSTLVGAAIEGAQLGSPSLVARSGDCAAGFVAAGFSGRAGTIIDQFAMSCYRLKRR